MSADVIKWEKYKRANRDEREQIEEKWKVKCKSGEKKLKTGV
jgi:hypothetical protein